MRLSIVLASLTLLTTAAFGQTPNITNAQMHLQSAASGLAPAIQSIANAQNGPVWIGYSVPIIAGDRQMCCWSNNAPCRCTLDSSSSTQVAASTGPIQLEASSHLV